MEQKKKQKMNKIAFCDRLWIERGIRAHAFADENINDLASQFGIEIGDEEEVAENAMEEEVAVEEEAEMTIEDMNNKIQEIIDNIDKYDAEQKDVQEMKDRIDAYMEEKDALSNDLKSFLDAIVMIEEEKPAEEVPAE